MKDTRKVLNGLIACGVALAMISTVVAQTANDGAATVVRIKGSARYTTGNNLWQPLKTGMQLKPGTVIQTGLDKGSYVDLVLGTGTSGQPMVIAPTATATRVLGATGVAYQPTSQQNAIRVFENSLLGIDKLTSLDTGADQVTETQLDLKQGRIMGNVKKMSAASKYEIKLPAGVAGIRGTVYDISADGIIQVRSGSVVAAWTTPDGSTKTQVVMGGEQFDIRTGQITRLSADVTSAIDFTANDMRAGTGTPIYSNADRSIVFISTIPVVSPTEGTPGGGF